MLIESIEWDEANLEHATRHGITADEIDQVVANTPRAAHNRKGRSATHLLRGVTDGGRPVLVAVVYRREDRTVRPVTAWEDA